jgi:hypothetical protein
MRVLLGFRMLFVGCHREQSRFRKRLLHLSPPRALVWFQATTEASLKNRSPAELSTLQHVNHTAAAMPSRLTIDSEGTVQRV